MLCTVCWEACLPGKSVLCAASSHALCDDCLSTHVRARTSRPQRLVESGGGIPCATLGCVSHPWALEDLVEHLDKDACASFGVALRRIFVDAPAAVAASAAMIFKRDAEARALALPARARVIVGIIVERDLWLRCPRCRAKYLDYSGCCALTCAANGCTFCGVCLELQPNDKATHAHFHKVHSGDIFDLRRVQATHEERRTGLVVAAVRSYAADGRDLQRAVIRELAREEPVPGFRVDAALLMCGTGVEMEAGHEDDPVALAAAAATASLGGKLLTAIADNCVLEALRLISAGADPTISDSSGISALLLCLAKPLPDIAVALISVLPSASSCEAVNKAGRTALHVASSAGLSTVVTALLRKGVNKDAIDKRGCTPLHDAVSTSNEAIAIQLIAARANPTLANESGVTAFFRALTLPLPAVALALISVLPASICDEVLVDDDDDTNGGDTALHVAVAGGLGGVIGALLDRGVNVNAVNERGRTPLLSALSSLKESEALQLIAAGADLQRLDNEGCSPLIIACREGLSAAAMAMLAIPGGVDVHYSSNAHGDTALHWACYKCPVGVISALLANKASINAPNNHGFAPLGVACLRSREDVALHLIGYGANVDRATTRPLLDMPEVEKAPVIKDTLLRWFALRAGVPVDAHLDTLGGELREAISAKRVPDALRLIAERANFVVADDSGTRCSALLLSCSLSLASVALAILEAPATRREDINFASAHGQTPLIQACRNGLDTVVPVLLIRGASFDALDSPTSVTTDGHTALWHSCTNGHEATALQLLAAGASVNLGQSCLAACGDRIPNVKAAINRAVRAQLGKPVATRR